MKRLLFFAFLSYLVISIAACKKTPVTPPVTPPSNPPVTPTTTLNGMVTTSKLFPGADETFTLSFDPSRGNTALSGFSGDVYLYAGVITDGNPANWKYLKYGWNASLPAAAKMTRQTSGKYTIDIQPRSFFGVPAGETIQKIAMLFRNADGSLVARNKDGSDIFLPLYPTGGTSVRFTEPELEPTFEPKPIVNVNMAGQELTVTAAASQATNLSLLLNGVSFATASNATQVSGKAKIITPGLQTVKVTAGGAESSFSFIAGGTVEVAALPAGAQQGVTFINGGTSAIFTLYAPEKSFVHVIGDFNNWTADNSSFMKQTSDKNSWWVQINNLDPNRKYSYQFLVDGMLKVADPYSEKVLDPWNDAGIPAANNTAFGTYPTGKTTGIVSWMKANQPVYSWKNAAFTRPDKNDLVIYELHLRDFMAANNYKTLKDTVSYLSRLGVNALELMPVTEFEGNSSWGYNPSFYFAPDKFYGNKQDLQAFIDECHAKGIAVIMDMVLNHSFGQSPMVQLYFDQATQKPAYNNPWFNASATHPFNVGYDFNHESVATKTFVKNVLKFWMQEYRVDGFRFDLSKGFTQKNSGTDVAAWSLKDDSRINIWKDYNNYIKSIDPNNFYVILEHFAADDEEQILAGEDMMLWNNINYNMNEATMGWHDNNKSDFKRGIYSQHGFAKPGNLITYMESHDEERLMFKNLNYGNASGSYNIKDLTTALKRQEMAGAFLFAMPGPKMIWQFGELGYDISIDQNGRTGEKPVLWNYNSQPARVSLKNAFSKFISLKKKNTIFRSTNVVYSFNTPVKYIRLQDGSNTVVVVGNFDVVSQPASVDFGNAGTWYDAAHSNAVTNLSGSLYNTILQPGEYHIFSRAMLNE